MVRPNAWTASAFEHRAVGHCPCLRPLGQPRTIRALAGRERKRFSPFEALAIFKLQKPTAVDDPVTEALQAVDLMYSANTEGTKHAASAAEAAKNGAKRAQDAMAADRATVDRLLEDLQKLNKEAREGGYSDVMLVDVALGSPRLAPQIAVKALEEEEDTHVEPDHKPVPLSHPDAPPKGVKAAEKRRAEGSGKEIILQAFNWESWKEPYYKKVVKEASWYAEMGFTYVWLPPSVRSVSEQGYMPNDYFDLNSHYGTAEELKEAIVALKEAGLRVAGDCVLNHRCAFNRDERGIYNRFGGKLDWDATAICGDDQEYGGRGHPCTGERFHAAPNIDHRQPFVREGICEWLNWLRQEIGIDGYRLDFVKGFGGEFVKEYCECSEPHFVVGEYWDSLDYEHGVAKHNQDAHRQRIINWINAAGDQATAFDVTTKGILHEVFGRGEYWRLRDNHGKPPGLLGWWPSRATTFLENHDTGSTQAHWPFPYHAIQQGYCYILTHPGTPTVFYDHLFDEDTGRAIKHLISIRTRNELHARSKVKILRADALLYVAEIDEKLIMKIGPDHYNPGEGWGIAGTGNCWCVWERE